MAAAHRGVALLAVGVMALGQPAAAMSLPGGGFSVSGKKGTFLKQVSDRKVVAAEVGGALGLASDAVNQGEFQAARLRMPQTEAKVAALLARIEAGWPYAKGQPLQVHILALDHYSAFSLPDGSIVVAFGLLDTAKSDDEVAFVLAHELGHVRLGHFAKAEAMQKRREMIARLGQLYAVGSSLRSGGMANFNGPGAAAARRASATADLLNFINNVMVEPAWSKDQEDEADSLGFDLAQLAPYAADSASAQVFDTIQADADNREALTKALEAKLKEELGRAVAGGALHSLTSGGGLGMGLLKGAGRVALSVAGQAEVGAKHRPPDERTKGIADYSTEAYPQGLPLRNAQQTWLKAVRATREYADARVVTESLRAAMKLRADGDYPAAEAEIAKARKTAFRDAPVLLNEAARLRSDKGDIDQADDLFTQAHLGPDQTYDGYVDHVRMLHEAGEDDRAMQVIAHGTERFGDDKPFLSLMIQIARQQGRQTAAMAYLRRCLESGDEGLKKDCQAAGGDGKGK